ncbi:hypothetical protein [Pseudobythopirellula maris]|uniref:hypothetical protein n=1 Tax=Pseudobythopirellula maris TaxID=2527991 RepID=UPI0011B45757|nr:hypothetical protein [Pseudobythopirellula maris]
MDGTCLVVDCVESQVIADEQPADLVLAVAILFCQPEPPRHAIEIADRGVDTRYPSLGDLDRARTLGDGIAMAAMLRSAAGETKTV